MNKPTAYPAHFKAINDLPSLRTTVEVAKLSAKKSLGQNFLFDLNLTDKIARSSGDLSESTVIEVGPGPGGLTRAILNNDVKKLIIIEHDARAIPILERLKDITGNRLDILNADALKIDYKTLAPDTPLKIIANLPYNIGTELLFKWLDNIETIDTMTLMFQKEVAERMIASPGNKTYGILSILTQFYCTVDKLFDINPAAFFPPPKVTSSVVFLKKRKNPLSDVSYEDLKHVTKILFQQRRKTLRQSAKNLWKDSTLLLKKANIDPQKRPENLSVLDFCTIAKHWALLQKNI